METIKIYDNPSRELWPSLTARVAPDDNDIAAQVAEILAQVREGGDEALRGLVRRIDGVELTTFEVPESRFDEAARTLPAALRDAMATAKAHIEAFHRAQLPSPVEVETMPGVRCLQRAVPIRRVGLYVPGGRAPLFSTVLMLAVPARIAGCSEVVLCTPPRRDGMAAPEILYAARLCGVQRVFLRYVTRAKQLVSVGDAAIDLPAGPSEVLVMADRGASPEFVAADLLSQAEHGGDSRAMLVCDDRAFAQAVAQAVGEQAAMCSRGAIIRESLSGSGIVVLDDPDDRIDFAADYAPEHLILALRDPWPVAERIPTAGSVFIGDYSPESAGDYASGTNHTLPTGGWGRVYSGVNTESFMRRITYQELTRGGLEALSPTIVSMAEAEGLDAHARAVTIRLKGGVR